MMYNARIFYNKSDGIVLHNQIKKQGKPLSIENEIDIVSEFTGVSLENIVYFEWDNPENELELLMKEDKVLKVDVSQTPPVLYGEEPEIIEPSEDDPISGVEFLSMIEGVM